MTARKKEKFGQMEGGTVLKEWRLVRVLYLHELFQIEDAFCEICGFTREILYSGSYDRNRNVESFNVCDGCGKTLIANNKAILKAVKERELEG